MFIQDQVLTIDKPQLKPKAKAKAKPKAKAWAEVFYIITKCARPRARARPRG